MLPRSVRLALLAGLWVTPTPGQAPVRPDPTPRASADVHTPARSRELFTGCDADGDDRLDLFEAAEALDTVGDPRDPGQFARLDRDRDGYLAWPEFDQLFRSVVQRGATFQVRTCRRPPADPGAGDGAATPLLRFLRLHDLDQDGGLAPQEIDQLVQKAGLPPTVGTQLRGLDLDRSGRVDATELAPFFETLQGLLKLPLQGPARPASPLPAPWGDCDDDGDGKVTVEEFTRALQRLDPRLAPWSRQVLQRHDRDRSGWIDAADLPPPPAAKRPAN